ncbi:hypothetical protein AB0K35_15500 [Micromonospora sp. NPDC053740]|uniref:hypothetical protein n=1 Tax=Micromonospora TaxID=1873 RepID=UPI001EE7CBA6|nr:hypothetical protein [Micromonospora alfalfae]MCG5460522.1 hypothetical protein [Micromonospora alfalfae]
MTNERVRSVGGYTMRILGVLAIVVGVLGIVSSLSQGNLVGVILGVVFIVGGAFLLKRSGATPTPRPRSTH